MGTRQGAGFHGQVRDIGEKLCPRRLQYVLGDCSVRAPLDVAAGVMGTCGGTYGRWTVLRLRHFESGCAGRAQLLTRMSPSSCSRCALGGVLSFARARGCGTVADAAVVCVVWAAIREGT